MSSSSKSGLGETLLLGCCLSLSFFPLWLTFVRLPYAAYNHASDTCFYLDIARNVSEGRGLVSSFNMYQFWPGVFYPAPVLTHVLLPLLIAPVYRLFGAVEPVIFCGLIIAYLNSFLIFKLVKRLYGDAALAFWVTLLLAASLVTEVTVLRVLTEPMSLFVTLAAFLLCASEGEMPVRRVIAIGILLGTGIFVRSASALYPPAFALAFLFSRDTPGRLGKALCLLAAPLAVVFVYEAAVFLRYGVFFPTYPVAFKNYYLATFVLGGDFFPHAPVLRPSAAAPPHLYVGQNAANLLLVIFCILRVFPLFAFIGTVRLFKRGLRREMVLFWLALLQVGALLLFYPYMRLEYFEWVRFLAVPVVVLAIGGIREFREFSKKFFVPRAAAFLFHAVLGVVFVSNFYQTAATVRDYWRKDALEEALSLEKASVWVQENTRPGDLIAASGYVIGKVCFNRPSVILPYGHTLSEKKLASFLDIYRPRAVVFERAFFPPEAFARRGYREAAHRQGASLCLLTK